MAGLACDKGHAPAAKQSPWGGPVCSSPLWQPQKPCPHTHVGGGEHLGLTDQHATALVFPLAIIIQLAETHKPAHAEGQAGACAGQEGSGWLNGTHPQPMLSTVGCLAGCSSEPTLSSPSRVLAVHDGRGHSLGQLPAHVVVGKESMIANRQGQIASAQVRMQRLSGAPPRQFERPAVSVVGDTWSNRWPPQLPLRAGGR